MNGTIILGKRIRHLSRYREIASILMRNGFGWFIDEVGLSSLLRLPKRIFRDFQVKESLSMHERIRMVLEQLGPTFVKIGQVASLRTDLLPGELTDQLARLRDEVPPMPFATVCDIVETELGRPMAEVFSEFSQTAIGSASIGQVHKAVLKTGETVAVKVQRKDIQNNIVIDFEILADIVRLAERNFEWARYYELGEVVEEFRRTLLSECDYTIEARNAERIRTLSQADPDVSIPEIYWDYTTPKVYVMEYQDGVKLNDAAELKRLGHDPQLLAKRTCNAVLTQVLVYGVFHADPHPGNLAALPGNRVLFMDFGMVGRLTPEMKRRFGALIMGLMRRRTDLIVRALYKMGVVPVDIDEEKFRRDVERLREKYYSVPLSQINMAESIRDIFGVAYKHRIRIPADLSLVGKTLITMEGVVEHLDPTFRIMDVAEAFGRRLLVEQLDPRNLTRQGLGSLTDAAAMTADLPQQLRMLIKDLRRGKAKFQVEVPEVTNVLNKLDRITNRISFSVMILALSIFMAGLMIASSLAKPRVDILNVPFTDIGLVVGGLMVGLLVWSILRSGRL